MHSIIEEAKSFCLSIDGTNITSNNCYIESMSMDVENRDSEVYSFGSRAPITIKGPPPIYTIELTIKTTDVSFEMTAEESSKIRYKTVEECSPEELLFAARTKLENKKN